MASVTPLQQCAYPGCAQAPAPPSSDRGAKPKYCADPDHNPLSAHRERRRKEAEASGQRAGETGGQPVTLGITRAAELLTALDKLTAQHADTLARAITELRAVGDIESAEAEVYAARASADQRVATAEARLAEEVQRRRDAETARDAARTDREQADDATAQAVTRMDALDRELADVRAAADQEIRRARDTAAAEIRQAREDADRDVAAAAGQAARQIADAQERAVQAGQDAARARQGEAGAIIRADRAQAAAADQAAQIRADHQRALDQLTAATTAQIAALQETRDALRIRAERAETDLDTARSQYQQLADQLSQVAGTEVGPVPEDARPAPRRASRTRKSPSPGRGTATASPAEMR